MLKRKSKKEILAEAEAKKKRDEQIAQFTAINNHLREIAQGKLLPYLNEKLGVLEAERLLGSLTIAIQQAFQNLSRDMLIKELRLNDMISGTATDDDTENALQVIRMIEEEPIAHALGLLDNTVTEIRNKKEGYWRDKKFSELNVVVNEEKAN